MNILIQKPGILTTVQDLGRQGYRRFGINPNGAMDQTAARLVNILLDNDENEAVLEMHFPAPQLVFESGAVFAIGGAEFEPQLDGEPLENWRQVYATKNSVLKFEAKTTGNRAYLAVKGGLKIDRWLDSSSTNLAAKIGGLDGRKLESGDRIALNEQIRKPVGLDPRQISASLIPIYSRFPTVRIVAGAEFEMLTQKSRDTLLVQNFSISNDSNRMGFRLAGNPLSLSNPFEMISAAATYGTVQLLPDGQLVVLMSDAQTAGGYPRVAHVITHDLPLLAQLGAHDKVAFHMITIYEAEDLVLEFERELSFFRIGCRFQANLK